MPAWLYGCQLLRGLPWLVLLLRRRLLATDLQPDTCGIPCVLLLAAGWL